MQSEVPGPKPAAKDVASHTDPNGQPGGKGDVEENVCNARDYHGSFKVVGVEVQWLA